MRNGFLLQVTILDTNALGVLRFYRQTALKSVQTALKSVHCEPLMWSALAMFETT